jgi:orotate phosphoribosyltransferase
MSSLDRARLLALLTERSYAKRKVVLTSGRESDFFVDCKQTVLLAEGHALVGSVMLEAAERLAIKPRAVAGVELGGCPLASAVSLVSFQRGTPLDAIYVRKQAKEHGSARLMEGDTKIPDGTPVAVLEDVITTGGSTLKAVEKLRERGLSVAGVVVLVDRQEGGAEALAAAGLEVISVFLRDEFPR